MQRKEQEEWDSKTPQEKLDTYKEQALYSRYCDMSVEELEKEKEFNSATANRLRYSIFGDPYYSVRGCEENIKRIDTILKLKSEVNK